jgi:hypothetical protein
MADNAQIQANPRNGELSTDPTTAPGNERSTQSALKDGLRRRLWVSKSEEHDLLNLAEELWACHAPVGAQEEELVKLMINDLITIDRLERIETSLLNPPRSESMPTTSSRKKPVSPYETTMDTLKFTRRIEQVTEIMKPDERHEFYQIWTRQGDAAATRFLDAIEGKGVQASDEAGNPAPFQQQQVSESGAEAATESPGD